MRTSPFAWVLFAGVLHTVVLGAMLGCGVTMAELKERNPSAKTLKVHCPPWQIPETVKLFAARSSGQHVHTDERPDELRDFAEQAGVFIEIDALAIRKRTR